MGSCTNEEDEKRKRDSGVLVYVRTDLRMNRSLHALQQVARRSFSNTARRQVENKVPEKQKLFQEDNGMPVYLKGGFVDGLLYRTTMTLTVLGTGYVVYELVRAAFPQKKN